MLAKTLCIIFLVVSVEIYQCISQKVTYMEIQQPVIVFVNSNYIKNLTVTSKRFGPKNLLNFLTLSGTALVTFDNTTQLHFYAYEKLLNGYKRSLVEVYIDFCSFLNEDGLFSKIFRPPGIADILKCPVQPGNYSLVNMTAPYGPYLNAFPFTEGRIHLNITYMVTNKLFSGYANINIKKMNRNLFYKYIKELRP